MKFPQGSCQPLQMGGQINRPAACDGDHLVHPVRELEPAILDGNTGLIVWNKAAVDIGDAGHGEPLNVYAG
jgi:hypothetical protein